MKKVLACTALAALFLSQSFSAQAADLQVSAGATSEGTFNARVGLGYGWDKSWWETATGRLTGYWDAGYTFWEAGDDSGARHSLSIAPVFVYEFSGESVKPFIEAGVGLAVFSHSDVAGQDLGVAFNFEDRLGFGMKFGNGQAIGIRAMHYSNAGLKEPNEGIESYSLFYSMPL